MTLSSFVWFPLERKRLWMCHGIQTNSEPVSSLGMRLWNFSNDEDALEFRIVDTTRSGKTEISILFSRQPMTWEPEIHGQ